MEFSLILVKAMKLAFKDRFSLYGDPKFLETNFDTLSTKKYAENKVVKIPTPNVTAKPLTGPDPRKKSISADINVVTFASNTAD